MALDNSQSFDEINKEINALKTLQNAKSNIKTRLNNVTNFDVSSLSPKSTIDNSAIVQKTSEVKSQIENLINTASNLSSPATVAFFLEKFFKAVKTIQPQLKQIVLECIVKSLGCDYEQTYQAGDVYVRVESIDFRKNLLQDPDGENGITIYEKLKINQSNFTEIPRSTNRLLYLCLQNLDVPMSNSNLLGGMYYGASGQPLFDITYVNSRPSNSNPSNLEYGNFFKISLISKIQGNKVTEFLSDYYETIKIFDPNVFFSNLLNASLENFQYGLQLRRVEIDDSTRFGLFMQRMLGECFDNDEEISVSGVSKVPELDDSSQTFFSTTSSEEIIIAQKIKNQEKGIIVLEDCDNVELPISALNEYIYRIVENIDENTDLLKTFEGDVLNSMVNDERWSKSFPFPDKLRLNMALRLLKNFASSLALAMLTPKVILPLMTMVKVLKKNFDDRIFTAVEFMKNFKGLMSCIISRVGAIFTKIMFNLIKKDLKGLLRAILIDWKGDTGKLIYLAIITLISVVKTASAFIRDYRRCKSIIDGIRSLLNLLNSVRKQLIPAPLLLLSELLPGFSVNRAFLNHITNLQKMGIPTGALPDGSPNLMLMRDFSMMEAFNREQIQNGKIEGVFSFQQIAPTGAMPAYVKVTGKYF